ncbi:hypothetical protein IVB34_34455 [Bradyrhizobium sp. 2]|uniref:hypothetical protein n=1 Tax=unclassified Bradyrhizobium TaxID=2631580 RepID=UPI001FF77D42|nr:MULTISPECIES: hypothetical protein [unclassified Bradyrhizobium]MCK1447755.1 hypothetical protein [Bradyrhizobium sp. 48]MCK1463324.1 hypothetical protein [Bradyrhizobium sp. 2]
MRRRQTTDHERELKRARDRRRYRRELAGRRVAPVDYSDAMVDYLVKYEWLKASGRNDPRCIGDAISRAVREAAEADQK